MTKEYIRTVTTRGTIPVSELVLFHSNFEHLIGFSKGVGIGDAIFELDPNLSFSGAQSLHIKTRTTDTAEDDEIQAFLQSHLPPTKNVSLLARFYSPTFTTLKTLLFQLEWYDGTNVHRAFIKYYEAVPKLTYLNSGGTETDLPDLDHVLHFLSWHSFNFPVDFMNNKYRSFQLDEINIDLSDLPIYTTESALLPHLRSILSITTAGAAPTELYIDNYIVLQS